MVDFAKAAKNAKSKKAAAKPATKGKAIPLDFSKVGNTIGLPQVPAVLEKMEMRIGQTGNPYLNTEFTVLHPEHMGRKLWLTTGLTPAGLWSTKAFFATMGIDVNTEDFSLQVDDADRVTYPNFEGSVVLLALEEQEWRGSMQDRVTHVEELRTPKGDATLLMGYSDDEDDEDEDLEDEDEAEDEVFEDDEDEDEDDEDEDDDDESEPEISPADLIKKAAEAVKSAKGTPKAAAAAPKKAGKNRKALDLV